MTRVSSASKSPELNQALVNDMWHSRTSGLTVWEAPLNTEYMNVRLGVWQLLPSKQVALEYLGGSIPYVYRILNYIARNLYVSYEMCTPMLQKFLSLIRLSASAGQIQLPRICCGRWFPRLGCSGSGLIKRAF